MCRERETILASTGASKRSDFFGSILVRLIKGRNMLTLPYDDNIEWMHFKLIAVISLLGCMCNTLRPYTEGSLIFSLFDESSTWHVVKRELQSGKNN